LNIGVCAVVEVLELLVNSLLLRAGTGTKAHKDGDLRDALGQGGGGNFHDFLHLDLLFDFDSLNNGLFFGYHHGLNHGLGLASCQGH